MIPVNFFGTREFAAAILSALKDSGEFEIRLVVTAPDRPVGRHQEIQKSPVKLLAEKYRIKTDQPESLKNYALPASAAVLNIVCQYGLIIPPQILTTPRCGSVNIHASLLPQYRGASPIQTALINGETETGITIMLMDEKMDHGPILTQKRVKITPTDTYATLSLKLAETAKFLLIDTARQWVEGKITPTAQNEAQATYCGVLTRDHGQVDWNKSADQIYNLFRGLSPWPGIWTTYKEKRLKLLSVAPADMPARQGTAGTAVVDDNRLFIVCQTGVLEALELQLAGSTAANAASFIRGHQNLDGYVF